MLEGLLRSRVVVGQEQGKGRTKVGASLKPQGCPGYPLPPDTLDCLGLYTLYKICTILSNTAYAGTLATGVPFESSENCLAGYQSWRSCSSL